MVIAGDLFAPSVEDVKNGHLAAMSRQRTECAMRRTARIEMNTAVALPAIRDLPGEEACDL